nr:hypothetical protein [Flavobacteriales bacterium]
MAKVFRIFKNSGQNKSNWFTSFEIGSGAIDSITVQETEGKKLPTSIPSPFAQMDLVRTAFKNVCDEFIKGTDLDSIKDIHRIVSNALDIGQILFKYETNAASLSIESWDKSNNLNNLKNSSSKKIQHLGKTLELFMTSADATDFNFDKLDKLFILKYNNRVIGGTSPKTLFFASADAYKINVEIHAGNDKMLDEHPLALYKRDKEYIKYWFYLKSLPNFANYFPEVNDYLVKTLQVIEDSNVGFGNELRAINQGNQYKDMSLSGNEGLIIEPLPGIRLKKEPQRDPVSSGFKIHTNRLLERPPLVLPVNTYTENIIYTYENWRPETEVPFNVNEPLNQRRLPLVNDRYPFLTINDFLADELIKLPYKIDKELYFAENNFENYLLPLKELFFDYFSVDDLIDNGLISFSEFGANDIEVTLRIPIQNGLHIPYTKKYSKNITLDLGRLNVGKIKEMDFTLGIYPFVKSTENKIDYTIAISETERQKKINNIKLLGGQINISDEIIKRDRSVKTSPFSTYYITNSIFDYMVLDTNEVKNIIIPKLKLHNTTGLNYQFSIDFGTTNTHIEYITNNNGLPTNFKNENKHFAYLRDLNAEFKGEISTESIKRELLLNQEVIHNDLGSGKYSFPFRSVLFENNTINYNTSNYLFSDVNIGFDYEKVYVKDHINVIPNLKWLHLNQNFNHERVEKFIRQLLVLCKNKVLMTNGNLEQTKIVWLYPTSMTYNQRILFKEIWEKEFKSVFYTDNTNNISSVPESLAPFYYYVTFGGLMNHTQPTVSIDVGGGTTDITVFEQNKPTLLTSFKYAGEALYGDGYSNNINNNGFVERFYSKIKKQLEDNREKVVDEKAILDTIYQKNSSVDVINFLFSLKDNHH